MKAGPGSTLSDEGTLVVDGVHVFDSFDEATRHMGVSNTSGLEFGALKTEDGLVPLTEIA
jgi:hypothetical protein